MHGAVVVLRSDYSTCTVRQESPTIFVRTQNFSGQTPFFNTILCGPDWKGQWAEFGLWAPS